MTARRPGLASARRAAGYTQEGLAEILGVDRSTVHRWEAGTSSPQPFIWPKLATVFGIGRDELGHLLEPSLDEMQQQSDVVDRRSVLQAGLGVGLLSALGESATGRSADPRVVEILVSLRDSLVSADSLFGASSLVRFAAEQARSVARLYDGMQPALRGRLFEIGALFAELCGWLADDLGRYREGRAWSGRALEWAHSSGNVDVIAYVLMRMSQQAEALGERAQASALAHSASSDESRVGNVLVRAALWQQRAHAAALDGDRRAAMEHVDTALTVCDAAGPRYSDPYSLAGYCTPTYLAAQRAAVLGTLGEYRSSLTEYERVLSGWPDAFHRERGLQLARHATVAARAGLPDAAVGTGTAALAIARDTRSHRIADELLTSAVYLQRWRSVALVKEFLQDIECEEGLRARAER